MILGSALCALFLLVVNGIISILLCTAWYAYRGTEFSRGRQVKAQMRRVFRRANRDIRRELRL